MAEHRVEVGVLATTLRTVGSTLERGRELGGQLAGQVPRLLPNLLDPILDGHRGVIRIQALHIQLPATDIGDPGQLAVQLCAAITRSVGEALRETASPVWSWPERTSYLADYLESRLGLRAAPAWCFDEFAPLDRLSATQTVVELVAREPLVLSLLARRTTAPQTIGRLDAQQCRLLLGVLLAGDPSAPRTPRPAPGAGVPEIRATDPATLARHALELLCSALAGETEDPRAAPAALLPVVMSLVALGILRERHSAATMPDPQPAAELLDSDLHAVAEIPAGYRNALTTCRRVPRLREFLLQQLRLSQDEATPAPQPGTTHTRTGHRPPGTDIETVVSGHAGAALLLPVITDLAAYHWLNPDQLRRAVAAALGQDEAASARGDPLLGHLFAADRRHPERPWPTVPDQLVARIDRKSTGLLAEPGADGWAGLLLAGLASRLPGLRASSAGYVRRQFLFVPGTLQLGERRLRVVLQGPDLAVVLAMAGLHGPQQPIPWLDGRILELELTGLRP